MVEISGCTVLANGRITVTENANVAIAGYVLRDRTTGLNYNVQVTNGIITYNVTASSPQSEPIVQDSVVSGIYWKIYIDNGIISYEASNTVQDDAIVLIDTGDSTHFLMVISDGNLGIAVDAQTSEVITFSENGMKFGSSIFGNIASITVSGISDGTLSIRGVNDIGQPVIQTLIVDTSLNVRFYTQAGRIKMQKPGQIENGDWKLMAEPDADIVENDLLEVISGAVGITAGRVVWKEQIFDFAGLTHHMEANIASY